MNGLNNGLYDGLNNGTSNGLYDGLQNGLRDGLFSEATMFDIDANLFINAANITNPREVIAITFLIKYLKSNNLWEKMVAIYPFLGSTQFSCSWNARRTNKHRIVFLGTNTFNDLGYASNGSTGFGNMNLNALSTLSLNSTHISALYTSPNAQINDSGFGVAFVGVGVIEILPRNASNLAFGRVNTLTGTTFTNLDSKDYFITSRISSASDALYKGGCFAWHKFKRINIIS